MPAKKPPDPIRCAPSTSEYHATLRSRLDTRNTRCASLYGVAWLPSMVLFVIVVSCGCWWCADAGEPCPWCKSLVYPSHMQIVAHGDPLRRCIDLTGGDEGSRTGAPAAS